MTALLVCEIGFPKTLNKLYINTFNTLLYSERQHGKNGVMEKFEPPSHGFNIESFVPFVETCNML